ncbi:MAG: DUF2807 domain-containing protein [Desulfobulbaceae bacterium]|nr:DUF2807 domain-containing protein [Desulfobulbaceae bacterium]
MKRIVVSMLAVVTLLIFNSFLSPDMPKEDVRKLEAFSGIGISVHAEVFYTPGNTHEITIEGDERDVDDLITEVEDGFLKIKYPNGSWRIKRSKLTIHVSSKELEAVKMSGSGMFTSAEALTSDEMEIAISGSGNIVFRNLSADEVGVKISGSGDVMLDSGSADEMDLRISGSGKMNAETFEVNEFSASISGSGGARITAKEELEVRISGSGSVYYHGNPRVNSSTSGSGKVRTL